MTLENQKYTNTIITQLVKCGVRSFCIAPGSRSSSLILSAIHHPLARTHVHYDERGLGFFALGIARATKQPTALIVTSGTALGNLYPAVMEAKMSGDPLIIISADRPHELQDCGANQTADQNRFFGTYSTHFANLPCANDLEAQKSLHTTIDYAVQHAVSSQCAVHINVMQRGPFKPHEAIPMKAKSATQFVHTTPQLKPQSLLRLCELLNESESGMISVGSKIPPDECEALFDLAERLKWPIIADITSCARQHPHRLIIPYASLLFKQGLNDIQPKTLLHFGERMVDKHFYEWQQKGMNVIHVTPSSQRVDPAHVVDWRVVCNVETFCHGALPHIESKEEGKLLELLREKSRQIAGCLHRLEEEDTLNETFLFSQLARKLNEESALFIGNSLVVRGANHAFYPKTSIGPIFANRGMSGIDGNIATIAGLCTGLKMPMIGVIGDQTFLHDINSIPLIKNLPICLIVLNNQGGRIFEHLPIAEAKEECKEHLINEGTYPLDFAGQLFNVPYTIARDSDEFFEALESRNKKGSIIELSLDPKKSLTSYNELIQQIQSLKKSKLARALTCYFA